MNHETADPDEQDFFPSIGECEDFDDLVPNEACPCIDREAQFWSEEGAVEGEPCIDREAQFWSEEGAVEQLMEGDSLERVNDRKCIVPYEYLAEFSSLPSHVRRKLIERHIPPPPGLGWEEQPCRSTPETSSGVTLSENRGSSSLLRLLMPTLLPALGL